MVEELKKVLSEIKNGNNLGERITLVGATKYVPTETILLASENGLQVVAENKVQEFREKTDKLNNIEQQFIGHLQLNKVKYLVGNVSLIQSVDTIELAQEIDRIAERKNVIQNILLEVNIGNEESKSGFAYEEVEDVIKKISLLKNVKIMGLMAMLVKDDSDLNKESMCKKMRSLYDKLNTTDYKLTILSIGMSGDYKIAIKNGSNMIRIGSLIFGAREQRS